MRCGACAVSPLMKSAYVAGPRLVAAGSLFLLLGGCSRDPSKLKVSFLRSGDKYFSEANYRAAEIELRNAIEQDPRFEAAHYRLAETYTKLSEFAAARDELATVVALNLRNGEA